MYIFWITDFEKRTSNTSEKTSMVLRTTFALYVNSTVLIILSDLNYDTIFSTNGFFFIIILYIFVSVFTEFLVEVFDLKYWWF